MTDTCGCSPVWACCACREAVAASAAHIDTARATCPHHVEVFDGYLGCRVNLCRLTADMTEDMSGCTPDSRPECPSR